MPTRLRPFATAALLLLTAGLSSDHGPTVDWAMVAKIREEGLQHSQVMNFEGYMVDVLGARLTLSNDMKRAQSWLKAEMNGSAWSTSPPSRSWTSA